MVRVRHIAAVVKVRHHSSMLRVRVRHVAAVVKVRKRIVVEVSIFLCFKVQWLGLGM